MRWARSATRHRISRERSGYVIQHAGRRFRLSGRGAQDDRLLYLGVDADGVELEVMAVEIDNDDLLVIHAMPLREKYRSEYEEAKKWRV